MRAGKCWRLYPETFHQNFMPPHTLAEMLRTPLEELVLQVRQDTWEEKEKQDAQVVRLQGFLVFSLCKPGGHEACGTDPFLFSSLGLLP